MMIRRLIAVFFVILVFCGCQADVSGNEDTTIKEELTLVVWDYDKINYDRNLVEAFEEKYPEVAVNVISFSEAYYDQKMESLLLSDKAVDVFLSRRLMSLRRMQLYDVVEPLDELIDAYGLDLAGSDDLDVYRADGKLYGIPYRRDQYVLIYNCDFFDRAGLEYPKDQISWEELYDITHEMQPYLSKGEYALMPLPLDSQWKTTGRVKTDERDQAESMRPIMELLLQMQREGCAPEYGTCIAQDLNQQSFELGDYGMYVGGTWFINYMTSDQKAGNIDFRWGVTVAPYWPNSITRESTALISGMSICKNSKNKELAWEFVKFATGEDGAKIMAEAQMIPPYMNAEIAEIYKNNFVGLFLDPEILIQRPQAESTLEIDDAFLVKHMDMSKSFRKCMTGQISVDEAIKEMQG